MTYFKGFYSGILEFLSKKMFSDFCIVRIQNLLNSKKDLFAYCGPDSLYWDMTKIANFLISIPQYSVLQIYIVLIIKYQW